MSSSATGSFRKAANFLSSDSKSSISLSNCTMWRDSFRSSAIRQMNTLAVHFLVHDWSLSQAHHTTPHTHTHHTHTHTQTHAGTQPNAFTHQAFTLHMYGLTSRMTTFTVCSRFTSWYIPLGWPCHAAPEPVPAAILHRQTHVQNYPYHRSCWRRCRRSYLRPIEQEAVQVEDAILLIRAFDVAMWRNVSLTSQHQISEI